MLTCHGTGASGRRYVFNVVVANSALPAGPGLYVICSPNGHQWRAYYVGEAESLDARAGTGLRSHEQWERAQTLGATHIGYFSFDGTAFQRRAVEDDLVRGVVPDLNREYLGQARY